MLTIQSRRRFLTGISAAGAVGLISASPSLHAKPPPEIMTVRLPRWFGGDAYCWAGAYIAADLLRAEGFTVQDIEGDTSLDNSEWLTRGQTDFDLNMPSMQIKLIDAGAPITILTGLHTGCF